MTNRDEFIKIKIMFDNMTLEVTPSQIPLVPYGYLEQGRDETAAKSLANLTGRPVTIERTTVVTVRPKED